MERDATISAGTANFLRERLFHMSDPYKITVCPTCGNIASNIEECENCKTDNMKEVYIPYASKLLCQELMAMGIKVKIDPTE